MYAARALLFLILHSLLLFPLVSSLDTLNPGETVNSTSYLVSANKTFTLGFYRNQNSNNSYLGIWYTGESDMPVWLANRNSPITEDLGILTITNNGTVHITYNGAADPIRLYTAESGINNITATLLDSGNFVIKGTTNSSGCNLVVLWQSFDYPTDTLLLGMKLGVNHRTGLNWTLTSWFSRENPASGAFTLEWDPSTRKLLIKRRGVIYWTSGDLKPYLKNGKLDVYAFDNIVPKPDTLNLNYLYKNVSNQDEDYFTYSLWTDSFTPGHRRTVAGWKMGYDGNLYDPDRLNIALADSCYGYNFRDTSNIVYFGCELWSQPKCRNRNQTFSERYVYFENVNETVYDDRSNLSMSDCRANCWNDCLCAAYSPFESGGCMYWRGGNVTFLQDDAQMSQRRYVLVSNTSGKNEGRKMKTIIITVVIVATLISIVGISLYIIVRRLKLGTVKEEEDERLKELMVLDGYTGETNAAGSENDGNDNVKLFRHSTILASTNSFSTENKLGEGGFGPVYKGKLAEGHEIAVKLMTRRPEQGLVEFKTELVLISKLQHRNLVKLLGFCIHGNDKMIVYDYMPNRSLDFFLFDSEKRELLNWETRFNIIEGIAQGLLYLHKYSRVLVIHRDLKAANILLDENMNPKISDFGLARIFKQNTTEANTTKRPGTIGYMAPEYIAEGIFSVKSDIYSFGVILLEIVSGRRNNSFRDIEGPLTLAEFAWEQWKLSAELDIMDQTLQRGSVTEKDQVKRCIQVGLLCVQNRASDRPPIEDVVSMLKNETSSLPMPTKPAFILRNDKVPTPVIPRSESQNEVSYSTFDGR